MVQLSIHRDYAIEDLPQISVSITVRLRESLMSLDTEVEFYIEVAPWVPRSGSSQHRSSALIEPSGGLATTAVGAR